MTRSALFVFPAVCVLLAVASTQLPAVVAAIVAVLVGVVAAAALWAVERARVDRLARSVNGWLGRERHRPVSVPAVRTWQRLAISLNALGAAYDRRGDRLARARRRREQLVDVLPEPALLFDEDGRLVRANPAARERFEIPTAGVRTAAQALGSRRLSRAVTEARDSGRTVEVEMDVEERALTVLAAPVGDEILLIVTDRTAQHRADAVRRDFVANASHELKTPVSGIQALAEGLEVTVVRDPERARSMARRLAGEADRLGKVVHDLLDLRRLEDGGDTAPAEVDLAEVVREEAERVASRAAERAVSLEVDVPDRAILVGVEDDLRLIVANLLDNAIGYNRSGGRVSVQLSGGDGAWTLRVADTGIGIAQHDVDRIFERFYRVDVARSRATGGTGLGLSLVRHATERQGGRVAVDSILGEGTTFTVVLPVEPT